MKPALFQLRPLLVCLNTPAASCSVVELPPVYFKAPACACCSSFTVDLKPTFQHAGRSASGTTVAASSGTAVPSGLGLPGASDSGRRSPSPSPGAAKSQRPWCVGHPAACPTMVPHDRIWSKRTLRHSNLTVSLCSRQVRQVICTAA